MILVLIHYRGAFSFEKKVHTYFSDYSLNQLMFREVKAKATFTNTKKVFMSKKKNP